jgi:hypothetical protein
MHHFGSSFGPPRAPQRQLNNEDRAKIDALLAPILAAEADLQRETETAGLSFR